MHELMPQHMARLRIRGGERHHHPLAARLRESAGPGSDRLVGDVRLPEVGIVGVKDDRFLLLEAVVEDLRVAVVPPLRHAGGIADRPLLFRIEMKDEVLRLERAELEILVLDLVATEVLRVRVGRKAARNP